MSINIELARFNMVEQQVRPWDVLDARVLDTLASVRREDFVPEAYRALAFADVALPLGHGENMLHPILEGRLLQALALKPQDSVLEVGSGSGFVTACLGRLARAVLGLEIHAELAARAGVLCAAAGIANARIENVDAFNYTPGQIFDAVAVGGAVEQIPDRFRDWVRVGGRLFAIRGIAPAMQGVLLTRVGAQDWREESLFETDLPYLIGAAPAKRFTF